MGLQDIQKAESKRLPSDIYNLRILETEYKATKKDPEKFMFALDMETTGNGEVPVGVNEDGTPNMIDPNDKKVKNWVVLNENNPDLLNFSYLVEQNGGAALFESCSKDTSLQELADILAQNSDVVAQCIKGAQLSAKISCEESPQMNEATGEPLLNPDTGEPLVGYRYTVGNIFKSLRQWV